MTTAAFPDFIVSDLEHRSRFAADWGIDPEACHGLTYAFRGGVARDPDGRVLIRPNGNISLPAHSTVYVERDQNGVVRARLDGFFNEPMARIETSGAAITRYQDYRPMGFFGVAGPSGPAGLTGPAFGDDYAIAAAEGSSVRVAAYAQGNIKRYGAKVDARVLTDGAMVLAQRNFTSALANFSSADIGKTVAIANGVSFGRPLYSTISSITSPTVAVLADEAGRTFSGATFVMGTDDSDAVQAAVDAASNGTDEVRLPRGAFLVTRRITLFNRTNVRVKGAGRRGTTMYCVGVLTSAFTNFPDPDETRGPITDWWTVGFEMSDFTIDMLYGINADNGTIQESWGTENRHADNYQYGLYLMYHKNTSVRRMLIRNCWFNGIEHYSGNDFVYDDIDYEHVGDKPNYIGLYTMVEIDGFSRRGSISRQRGTDVGNGVGINGTWPNENPEGGTGSFQISVTDITLDRVGLNALWILGDVSASTFSRIRAKLVNKQGVSAGFQNVGLLGARGPRGLVFDDIYIDGYNLAVTDGVAGADIAAYDSAMTNCTFINYLGITGTLPGVVIRSIPETTGGGTVVQSNFRATDNTVRGSFHNSYGMQGLGPNIKLRRNAIFCDNNGLIAGVFAEQAGSADEENDVVGATQLSSVHRLSNRPTLAIDSNVSSASDIIIQSGVSPSNLVWQTLTRDMIAQVTAFGASKNDVFTGTLLNPNGHTLTFGGHVLTTASWMTLMFDGTAWVRVASGPVLA